MFSSEENAPMGRYKSFPKVKPLTGTVQRVGSFSVFISLPGIPCNGGTFGRGPRKDLAEVVFDEYPQFFRTRCREIIGLISNSIAAKDALHAMLAQCRLENVIRSAVREARKSVSASAIGPKSGFKQEDGLLYARVLELFGCVPLLVGQGAIEAYPSQAPRWSGADAEGSRELLTSICRDDHPMRALSNPNHSPVSKYLSALSKHRLG